ncbi:MAG TPA: ABC transporter ATP-binding protein [Sulfurovum sp.]|nr:ABC transporter ATP-binding protein [Sulfurovum sp.]
MKNIKKDNSQDPKTSVWYGIRFLYPQLKKYKKVSMVILVAMVMVAVTSALSAYIFKYILNDIFINKDEQALIVLPLVVIALFFVRGLARFASSYLTAKVGVAIANTLRESMFTRLIRAEFGSVGRITTGDINAVIIQTALNIQNTISKTLPGLIISAFTVLALIVMILYTDWRLSLYAIAVAVLMVVPVKMLGKGVKRHTASSEDMITELSNRVNESFNNFDLVKVYGREEQEKSLFVDFLKRYEIYQVKLAKYQLLSSPFMEFFVALAIAVVIFVGGHFVIDGSMTAGDFFAFMVALMMLYAPIKSLTQNYIALYMLNSFIERVENILSLPIEKQQENAKSIEKITDIEFSAVSYSIGDSDILRDVSFDIQEGDRVAIVGKSGAGKSSIISLLFGLGVPTKGSVNINKSSLGNYSPHQFRKQISYVNQSAGIFNASIQDNILYGETLDKDRYERAKLDAQCDFIEQMPSQDQEIAGEFGKRLSGGQRQRIALARAIYRDGSLFVLDEATSALDANTESLIQKSLVKVMRSRTSIIIAHRLATIQICNKVMVVENGEIVAYGAYDEVSKGEAFRRNFMMDGIL